MSSAMEWAVLTVLNLHERERIHSTISHDSNWVPGRLGNVVNIPHAIMM